MLNKIILGIDLRKGYLLYKYECLMISGHQDMDWILRLRDVLDFDL